MTDYHQYVIKDGKFVGAFDEMYRNCPDPWKLDGIKALSRDITLFLFERLAPSRILDLGCGTGSFTEQLKLKCRRDATVVGVDLSPTALMSASQDYRDLRFCAARIPELPFQPRTFDCVVVSELLWYILPQLTDFFLELKRLIPEGGHFMILQHFYRTGQQLYGNEYMEKPEDLLEMLPFDKVEMIETDRFSDSHKLIVLGEV